MMMPRPLSGCQMKAEIQCFLLMYGLFQYQQWFFQDIERPWIPEMTSAPCNDATFRSFIIVDEKLMKKMTIPHLSSNVFLSSLPKKIDSYSVSPLSFGN
jgi:hypothetical protein